MACQQRRALLILPDRLLSMGKVLVIRFSSIGDVLLTTPVVRQLARNNEVHVLTKAAYASLFIGNPHVSKVLRLEKGNSLPALANRVRSESYTAVYDLHRSWRSIGLRLLSGHWFSPTYRKGNWGKIWMVKRPRMLSWPKADQYLTKHVVDRYRATVKAAADDEGLDISPESIDIQLPADYNVLVVGAKQFTKRIPLESLKQIAQRSEFPVVLLGGPDDKAEAESVMSGLPESKTINLAGSLSLRQSAGVLAGARRIVCPDTGMMHVATALQKPVAVLWGSTTPEFGFAPFYGGNGLAEIEAKRREAGALSCSVELPCRPCTRTGFDACPQGHFRCMKNQDLNRVISWLNQPS